MTGARSDIADIATGQDGPWPPTVYAHADLDPFHILVPRNDVIGIIDREFAGGFRHYREYISARYGDPTRPKRQGDLDKFLEPFLDELQKEKTRQKWWG